VAHLIDRWVIQNTIRILRRHPAHLQALDTCHINLSGSSFDQTEFTDFVESLLRENSDVARKICFEITETAAISNMADVRTFMSRLTRLGCRFALDDFGAGLSSFGYLKQLPVDYLKIDGSFIRNIAEDKADCAMVKAINDIAHTLNKLTVAEFVENEAALERLRLLGVDYAQGFHLHRPSDLNTLSDQSR